LPSCRPAQPHADFHVGQDQPPLSPPPPQPRWETLATAGLTLRKGNSDTLLANLGVISARKWQQNELGLGASFSYGEAWGRKNVDNINGSAQFNRLFSDRSFAGLKVRAVKDAIADLDYRVTFSPLAGYYFVKEAGTRLSAEVGPSYVIERLGSVGKSYAGLRVGERFEDNFNTRAKIWQTAEFTPQVDLPSKHLVSAELGVSSAMNDQVSLRVVLQDSYDSIPAPGRQANDVGLISGLEYKF
jgi:hypothetical protein